MTIEDQASLLCYKIIAPIHEKHKIYTVRNINTGKIYVRKDLSTFSLPVYEYLRKNRIPNIPHIEELFLKDDQLIVIEEYISGNSLEEILKMRGKLTEEETIHYAMELCRIVSNLHSAVPPIIHRDIKPSNIMVRHNNTVCLLDFNASKHNSGSKTQDTVLLGTNGYAAPEQYGFGSSNERSDIYAIGKLINTMLMGLNCTETYSYGSLSKIIGKATALDPKARYQDINQLMAALLRINGAADDTWSDMKKSAASKLPPGFRTGNYIHMATGLIGYILIFWLALTVEVEGISVTATYMTRLCYLAGMLALVAFTCNYQGLRRYYFFCRSPHAWLRFLGIIISDVIIAFFFLLLMIIAAALF